MIKPGYSHMYSLREISKYIDKEEGREVGIWDFFTDTDGNHYINNYTCLWIDQFEDISEEEMKEQEWLAKDIQYCKLSTLIYKYFPDADCFLVCW